MNWPTFDAFLNMGGHGLYVWGSYAVAFGVMAIEAFFVGKRFRSASRKEGS